MELPGTKRTHHPAGHWITSSRRWCALGDGREIILSHAGCALSVILADRDQQESMPVDFEILDRNTGGHSNAGNLAALISPQRSKIGDLTVLPKDSINFREADQWIDYAVF